MGYIQLLATGAQDFNLIGNPQISFYKIVYRRYSNFSVESKRLKITGNTINNSDTVMLECDIKRDADLLSNVYFTFELPEIYSGCYATARGAAQNLPYEFRWVENIGTNIINNVKLYLNDSVIHSYSGEYLQVMSELRYDDSKKKIYDELVGNVPEMHNPALHNRENNLQTPDFVSVITAGGTGYAARTEVPVSSNITLPTTHTTNYNFQTAVDGTALTAVSLIGNQYDFVDGTELAIAGGTDGTIKLHSSSYPHIRGTTTTQHNIHRTFGSETIIPHDTRLSTANDLIPSIRKRKIKVPLNFYFSKSTGLALPLISLQYTQVKVEIKLNPIRNLYTVLDYKDNQVVRVKPESSMTIDRFTERELNINPFIEAEYVYLDNDERTRFALATHEYLIEDVFAPPSLKNIKSKGDHNIILHHPVKELIVVSQRSDMEHVNNWNNYSNWPIENVSPTSFRYNNIENMYYSNITDRVLFYNRYTPSEAEYKKEYFNENIIEKMSLLFDGHIRLDKKDSGYFNHLQPFQHHKRKIKNGIHVYSFSLKPDDFQPSGACNFSRVNNFKLHIDPGIQSGEKEIPKVNGVNHFNYNFNIYAVHYNILKIASGLGAKQYVN